MGKVGEKLRNLMYEFDFPIYAYMDNNYNNITQNNVTVEPVSRKVDDCYYVITPSNKSVVAALQKQLEDIGIKNDKIIHITESDFYDIYKSAYEHGMCKKIIERKYKYTFNKTLNWNKPKRYTEMMCCDKLQFDDSLHSMLADKVNVREWVAERIGKDHLVKQIKVWDSVDEIDWDSLPDKYVLKINNGSGRNIIVKDKNVISIADVKEQLNLWLTRNYALEDGCYEMQYKNIVPKIICEEYLEGIAESLFDYDIFCFNGRAEYICCIRGSHRPECRAAFYDRNWIKQEFSFGWPFDSENVEKPEALDEMIRMSETLANDFDHIRVDWYILSDGRILFSELTLTSWSGMKKFIPDEYDEVFGSFINYK